MSRGGAGIRPRSRVMLIALVLFALFAGLLAGAAGTAPAQAATTASISGTVTANGERPETYQYISVVAWNATGGIAGWVNLDDAGKYTFGSLSAGSYTVRVSDGYNMYATQWWSGKATSGSADPIVVGDAQAVTGKDFALVAGSTISGNLTDSDLNGLYGTVVVYGASDATNSLGNVVAKAAVSGSDGSYTVPGLAAGSYKVGFTTYSSGTSDDGSLVSADPYVAQWYSGKYSYATAQTVVVPASQEVSNIDAALENPYFKDVVDPSYSFYTYIEWMAANGISQGTAQTSGDPLYKPADAVSRQAMASFLFKLSKEDFTAPATPTFADVDATSPFYTAIEWMASKGISTGTAQASGKPLYKAAEPVSRQAMALFLARYAGADVTTAPTMASFADVPITSSPAAAIDWMKRTGISTGTAQPSGLPLYKPTDAVSRQAMAAFLYRFAHPTD